MQGTIFEKPVKVRIDSDCETCRRALRTILREKLAFLVITPDFNASGRVTHHHIEAQELSDNELHILECRREFAAGGDIFCQACDVKCQLR